MAKNESWSFNAWERGRSWVRAYEDGPGGVLLLEWMEPVLDAEGEPVTDAATGKLKLRRKRLSTGHRDRERAKKQAKELAERFAEQDPAAPASTLRRLLNRYLKEVTPGKAVQTRRNDTKAVRVLLVYFGQQESSRGPDRHPTTLDRTDWEGFIIARRAGTIPGYGPCRSNQVKLDLKFLLAVLAWAAGAEDAAPHFIARNPWSRERRRAQGMEIPREKNPLRPGMTDAFHRALLEHSPDWRFSLVLHLCRETMHRVNSVRQLRWEDLDLAACTVHWKGQHDKTGRELVTPLTARAVAALREAPRVLGSPWVVPSETDPQQAVPCSSLHTWMRRAKKRAGVQVAGLGFHGHKRAGVRRPEFRALPPKVQESLTGTTHKTLRDVYDDVSVDEMRDALRLLEQARRPA